MKYPVFRILLTCQFIAAPFLGASNQTMPITDSKPLMLNKVWTRLADIYGEEGSIESVEFSPDSSRLVSGSKFDNSVIVWRTSDGQELWRNYVDQEIERVAWTRDGKTVIACSEDYKLTFFDAETGDVTRVIEEDAGIDGLATSHDGRYLGSGSERTVADDGTVHGWLRIYSLPEAKLLQKLDFGETINEVDFSRDNQYVLAIGHDEKIRVWRTSDWSRVADFIGDDPDENHFISGRFSPDGSMIVAGNTAGDMYVYDFKSGKVLQKFNRSGHKIEVIVFSPNGQYLATAGNDPYIRFFRVADVLSGDRIYTALQYHAGDQAEYLDFNSNGSLLSSAHQDGTIHLFVVMSEDPTVNSRRHEWVKGNQRDAN